MPFMMHAQDQEEQTTEVSMQDLAKTLESEFRALKTSEGQGDKKATARHYGKIAAAYLGIGKKHAEEIQASNLVPAEKKANLTKCIEYAEKSVATADEVGDVEQMKSAYQSMYAAQKNLGKVGDAMGTYKKIQTLKHAILNPKKLQEMKEKELQYEHQKREDSMRRQKELADQRIKEQNQALTQQQQQLQTSNQNLTAAQKEKEDVNKQLQKTQTDLSTEKSVSEEKTRQLTQAEQEKALLTANQQLTDAKVQLQQNEIKMKDDAIAEQKKLATLYIAGLIALLAICGLIVYSFISQKKFNKALMAEKQRSEDLLLNILPAEVAGELKQRGFADAKHFYDVTVLFTDFVSFTTVAESMTPEQLVGELHICFKAFDVILGKYRIEKIKTVGDAYLAVSGLPIANPNHALDVVSAAIEIRDFMANRKKEMGKNTFGIRLGINSGNVVAGIVGVRKFSYDIWGDTVNTAARMEQNSEEGRINISDTTYQLIKDKYPCVYRGKVSAKNKGDVDMYYIA